MNKKGIVIAIGLTAVIAMAIFFAYGEVSIAQECRIVRIHGGVAGSAKKVDIEPQTLWISKGGCVIWNNWVRTDEIKVIFEEGKKCEDMTDSPMGFKLDAANCYVTTWIPLGGTSSLRFNEEGAFEYSVEAKGGIKARGKIVVR